MLTVNLSLAKITVKLLILAKRVCKIAKPSKNYCKNAKPSANDSKVTNSGITKHSKKFVNVLSLVKISVRLLSYGKYYC